MAAVEPLYNLLGKSSITLLKEEAFILEAIIFVRICDELSQLFKVQNEDCIRLNKINYDMEKSMLEDTFTRCVINDILASGEYTISGIAYYTQTPEEVVYEVATGRNNSPSIKFVRRAIELHKTVRRDLYFRIIKKILDNAELIE